MSDGTATFSWTGGTAPYDISGDLNQTGATSPYQFTDLASGDYTITVTDANGCMDEVTVTVGESPGPDVSGVALDATCGDANGEVEISWTGGTSPYDISGDFTETNATSPSTYTDLTSGDYTVTVTDFNGCTDVVTVTVGDSPDVSANATATSTTCGQNNGEYTVSWSGGEAPFDITGDLGQTGATSPTTFTDLGSGTYTVTITDTNGCTASATATIGSEDGPVANASTSPSTCGAANGSVTIAWTGGNAPYNISGDLNETGATSPTTFTDLSAGTYNVTVTDGNGCTSVASGTINDTPGPDVVMDPTAATCGDANGEIVISWTDGTAPFDITGDFTETGATSPTSYTDLSVGTYTITITDANGCTDEVSTNVVDTPGPDLSFSNVDATCGAENGSITFSWTGGTEPIDISGDFSQSSASSPQTFTGLGAGDYTITVTDANGCTDEATVTVDDIAGPDASGVTTDANCGMSDGSITISWTGGTPTFDISGDLNQIDASSPSQFDNLSSGDYSLTVTDANGCTDEVLVTVGDTPSVDVMISGVDASCGLANGSVSVSWTDGTGPFDITGDLSMTNATSPTNFTDLSSGNYTVTVTDANGCTDEASISLSDTDPVSANGTSTNTTCGQNDGEVTISWSGGEAPYDISGDLNQSGATSPHVFADVSSGSYTVTVTDINGCTDEVMVTVGNEDGPTANANSSPSTCGNADGTVTVAWNGGSSPYTISGDLNENDAMSPSTFTDLLAGTYNVTVTDANGCTSVASATINDTPGPDGGSIVTDATCGQSDGSVVISWTNGTAPFDITGDLSQLGATSPQTFDDLAIGDYSVTITDANGCEEIVNFTISDTPGPDINGSFIAATCELMNGSISLSWTNGTAPFDITGDLNLSNATSPQTFTNLSAGDYTMTITDANGCTDMVTITITDTPGPALDYTNLDANCGLSDGSITLNWTGGVGPYDISGDLNQTDASSPSQFNGLAAGDYMLTLTDANGCESMLTIMIADSPSLEIDLMALSASCGFSNGEITVSWTGGSSPVDISGDLTQTSAPNPTIFDNLSSGNYTVTVTDANGCSDVSSIIVDDSPAVNASFTSVGTTCGQSDGEITVNWNGGEGPFDISGDLNQTNATNPHTFTDLSSGSYTATVTDMNGCTDVITASVTNEDGPTANANSSPSTCGDANGSVTVAWNGGVGPYSIFGDLNEIDATSPETFTNLSEGTYTVTVTDANGCTSVASSMVNNTDGPDASVDISNANCDMNDGVIIISWSDGTAPFDITGDLNQTGASSPELFSDLSPGDYSITITDANGCVDLITATVNNEVGPSLSGSSESASCGQLNGQITLSWGGGTPNYEISGDLNLSNATSPQSFNNLASGVYNVTITDSEGCEDELSLTIDDTTPAVASFEILDANCGMDDGSVTISWSGGVGPFDISGDLNETSVTSPHQFTSLFSGNYSLILTDNDGCETVIMFIIDDIAGPQISLEGVDATCGEENGEITVSWTGGAGPFEISGGSLFLPNANSPEVFDDLPSGNYTVVVTDNNGCSSSDIIVLGDSPSVSASGSSSGTSCGQNDGTVTISWSGGSGTFNITGDLADNNVSSPHVFSNLGSGTYTITVTDTNGCTDEVTSSVTNEDGPTASTSSSPSTCGEENGSITVFWNGGSGPYDISGDLSALDATSPTSFDNQGAGSYNIIVTDASGCSSIASVIVDDLTGPDASFSTADAACGQPSGSFTISWSEGTAPFDLTGDINQSTVTSPYTELNVASGTYNVTLSDANGCEFPMSIEVDEQDSPIVSAENTNASCNQTNGTITISWIEGNGPFDISGDLNLVGASSPQTFTALSAGDYTIIVTDQNGCSDEISITVGNEDGQTGGIQATAANCGNSDGTITVSWMGGNGPYSISGDLNATDAVSPALFDGVPAGDYSIIVTDVNGCTLMLNVTVGDIVGPDLMADPIATTCGNQNGQVSLDWINGTGPYNISGDLNLTGATSPQLFTDLPAGNYTIQLTDANGCMSGSSFFIGESEEVFASSTTVNTSCGESVGSITISWSGGTGPFDISGDLSGTDVSSPFTFDNLSSGTYSLNIIDAFGCSDNISATISNDDGPTASANGLEATCGNDNGTVSVFWNGGVGPYDITGDLASQDASSPAIFTDLSAGTYNVTVTDGSGCTSVASATIEDSEGPEVGFNVTNASCGLDNGSINISWSEGTGPFDISGDLTDSNVTSPHVFINLGQGAYSLTLTDANGCEAFINAEVEGSENVMLEATANCLEDGTYEVIVTTNADLVNNDLALPVINNMDGTYTISNINLLNSITITAGFSGTNCTEMLTIGPPECECPAIADAGLPGVINCEIDQVLLGGTNTSTGSEYSYEWTDQNDNVVSTDPAFLADTEGTYTLTVFDQQFSCSAEDQVLVTDESNEPTAIILADPGNIIDCELLTIELSSGENEENVTYSWIIDEETVLEGFTITVDESGEIILIALDTITGCFANDTILIESGLAYPLIDIEEPAELSCTNDDVLISALNSQNGLGITHQWYDIDGNPIQGATDLELLVDMSGFFILESLDSENGCTNQDTVFVGENILLPEANAGADITLPCNQDEGQLLAITNGNYDYSWWTNDMNNTISDPSALDPMIVGEGWYYFEATNILNGCSIIDSVLVNAAASPDFDVSAESGCFGEEQGSIAVFDVEFATEPYQFYLNGEEHNGFLMENLAPGDYEVSMIDANGCAHDTIINIVEFDQVILDAENHLFELNQADDIDIQLITNQTDYDTIIWSPEIDLTCDNCLDPSLYADESISYIVTMIDENGCSDTTYIRIELDIEGDVYIPNIFGPNEGTDNGTFFIQSDSNVERIDELWIYDRWGELMFYNSDFPTNDRSTGWDGTYKDVPCGSQVFVYVVKFHDLGGKEHTKAGDVTLVR